MSLNKITNSSDYLQKQYLNIGCNDIKCSSLEINGSAILPSSQGNFIPTISAQDASTFSNKVGVYNTVGTNTQAVFECAIKSNMVVATSSFAYILTIILPDGWKCLDSTNIVSVGNLFVKGATADSYIVENCVCVADESTVDVKFNINGTGPPLPVGVGEIFLNFTLKCLVKK